MIATLSSEVISPPSPAERAVRATPIVVAGLVASIAAMVLVGWAIGSRALTSQMLTTAMNPATAVAFLLAATALALSRQPMRRTARRLAIACAAGILVIACSRLADDAFRTDFSLDEILFRTRLMGNVMAPNTAAMFAIVAASILLLDVRVGRVSLSQPPLLAGGAVALFCLVGYLYAESSLIGLRGHIPMALNTAATFFVLIVGLLCVRPEREPLSTITSDTLGGVVARRLLPAAFIVPLLLGWLRLVGVQRGYFDHTLGLSLFVLAVVVTFHLMIWLCARVLLRADLAHRETEAKVHASEQRYRSILEQAAEGIYLVDLESRRVVDSNNAFDRMLGYPADGTIGLAVYDLVSDSQEHVEARLAVLAAADGPLRGERMYVRRDGTGVEVESSASVVNCAGRPMACTVVRDITARKKAERELQEKNRQLQESYRAEQAAREALQRAQSQLVENEKLAGLGQTVAGVAHEINNPLSFVSNNVVVLQRDVKGLTELLALYQRADPLLKAHDAPLAEEVAELIDRIDLDYTLPNLEEVFGRSREGLRRIQQIVKDLRDFARLDEGDPHEVDLNEGINSTINIVQGRGKQRRVSVAAELTDLPPITCQNAKINQVVMNLVANAIDASPEGGRVLVRSASEGGDVRIDVIDTGTGVPPAIRGKIFDPFFTTKPQGQGTGLGLSISYGIVRDHGGTITVGDAPGGGAIFTVRLPIKRKESAADPA